MNVHRRGDQSWITVAPNAECDAMNATRWKWKTLLASNLGWVFASALSPAVPGGFCGLLLRHCWALNPAATRSAGRAAFCFSQFPGSLKYFKLGGG
jgi:hypothetical protein